MAMFNEIQLIIAMMFLHNAIFMEDISSCCSHVVIETHGAAAQHQVWLGHHLVSFQEDWLALTRACVLNRYHQLCGDKGGPVECMWNDRVRFVGGDMKGDNHHGTRQESSSGCREKRDGTKGCYFWSWRRSEAGINCWLKRERHDEVREK